MTSTQHQAPSTAGHTQLESRLVAGSVFVVLAALRLFV